MYRLRNKKGFVLVYAVFLSGIILTIGVGALGLVLRGFQLSTTSRESQKALFAADSAIECVVYWDLNFAEEGLSESPFAITDPATPINQDTVFCNGTDIRDQAPVGRSQNEDIQACESGGVFVDDPEFPFREYQTESNDEHVVMFDLHFDNGAYAAVTVERSDALATEGVTTRVSACGFNHDDPDFSRRVERGITFQY